MAKLPKGLYRRRRRDGTESPTLWCYYYVPGRAQPIKESTRTADVDEARRFLFARRAEHPTVRAERIAAETITVGDALTLLSADRQKRHKWIQHALVCGLRHAIGHHRVTDLRRKHLDEVCDRWQSVGIIYPERDVKMNRVHPVSGTTCNHGMRTLRAALRLSVEKLGGVVPPALTFPHFDETVVGHKIEPAEFYGILGHIQPWQKAALVELAYLTGVRKNQLVRAELRNVRAAHGNVTALVWEAPKTKNRQPHTVPLTKGGRPHDLVQQLWENRRLGCPLFHIDGRPLGDMRSEWRRACAAAGVPCGRKVAGGVVFHDTRVSAISNMADAGVPDTVARSISGHRTPAVHARYQITAEHTKADALDRAEERVRALASPK
jgi:integrase-like protein